MLLVLCYLQSCASVAVGTLELTLLPLVEHTDAIIVSQLVSQVRYTAVEGFASTEDTDDSFNLGYRIGIVCRLGNCIEGH